MQDDIKDALDRGQMAKHELPLAEERIELFKKQIYTLLEACGPNDDQERRNLCQALQISTKVLEYLTQCDGAAKLAASKLDEIRKVGKKSIIQRIIP